MANQTCGENTTMDDSTESEDLTVAMSAMSALNFAELWASWILNVIVIRALLTIPDARLKVRFLIINAVVSDILLASVLSLRNALQLADDKDRNVDRTSPVFYIRHILYGSVAYFGTFYQIFASVAVAFDRFYSICFPLNYRSTTYGTARKLVILTGVFGVAFGLSFPVIMEKLNPSTLNHTTLITLGVSAYSKDTLPVVLIGAVVLTLSIYAAIFVLVIYHRRKSQSMTSQNASQAARNRQASIAVTFFMISITYVLLYLPGAIYYTVGSDNLKAHPVLDYCLEQVTIFVYLGNTLVDPLIYIFRIRSIREIVRQNGFCCPCRKTRQDTHAKP